MFYLYLSISCFFLNDVDLFLPVHGNAVALQQVGLFGCCSAELEIVLCSVVALPSELVAEARLCTFVQPVAVVVEHGVQHPAEYVD